MIDYFYTVRTVDNRKYSYICGNSSLGSVYKGVKSKDYIEVTKWGKDKEVLIDTKHIVSIEKW
uniref:Uncharacterized protein n=1 Tax=Mammaliicoccus phage MSShimriz1 TaxID=3230127 RepID=A0AAU8GT54_9VIRU